MGSNRRGRSGEDLVIEVPVGTQVIKAEDSSVLFDFTSSDESFTLVRGGRGGRGNAAFATSTNQAPREAEDGETGQEIWVILELKVLADVGLIGYPNAGKSTLISVVSAARPKIADYPFTTLTPQLGVVEFEDFQSVVVADIPGLIEGAHGGTGLGDQFLRHVERCRALVHLIDVSDLGEEDPVAAYATVNRELELYSPTLKEKPQLVVASKMDVAVERKVAALEEFCSREGLELLKISSATSSGIVELKRKLLWLCKNQSE
jgi:GTP-binding protein